MKHKLYTRLLSLALVLGLVAGMLPGVTFAGAVDSDATALQSQVEQIAEPTEEPETVSEESSQAEATPTPAPESSQVEETPAPTEEPVQEPENNEDTESAFIPPVNYTNVAPLFANLLKGVSTMGINALADTPDTTESTQTDGLFLDKNSVATKNGRGATITLNSYITGKVTTTSEKVPTDIVLVLDTSGSMSDYTYSYTYHQAGTDPQGDGPYYIKDGDSYVEVEYCDVEGYNDREWSWEIFDWVEKWVPGHENYDCYHNWVKSSEHSNQQTVGNNGIATYNGEMKYTRTRTSTSKLQALKNAVNSFITSVYNDANDQENPVDHRVSIVTFASGSSIRSGLRDMANQQNYRSLSNIVSGLSASGSTSVGDGMENAVSVMDGPGRGDWWENDPVDTDEERNKVVILFTDGGPGYSGWGSSDSLSQANAAITAAHTLKLDGTTVYTIGMQSGADPTADIGSNSTNWGSGYNSSAKQAQASNRMLHLISSNYPSATSMSNSGNKITTEDGSGYYLAASDSDSLSEIFQKINDQITGEASVDLDTTTEMRDVVSQYFTAPAEGTVKVYTEDYVGNNTTDDTIHDSWKNRQDITSQVDIDIAGKTVTVKGFDYSKYFVSNTARPNPDEPNDTTADFYGKRLIVEFTVNAEKEFWGGNKVPTNEASSGIYHKGEEMATYPVPTVDVKLKEFSVQAKDQNVYYNGSTPALTDLYTPVANFEPDDWTTEFVNLTYSFTNTSTTVSNITDGTYGITATLSPTATGTYKDKTAADTASVNVFKPEITWKDTTKDAGTDLTVLQLGTTDQNLDSEAWVHTADDGTKTYSTAEGVVMFKEAPALTYTFTNESGGSLSTSLATDEHVKVGVAINDTSVGADVVTFLWTTNTEGSSGCTAACDNPNSEYQFRIHVGNGDLTIVKQISGGAGPYDNAVFDFKIEAENGMVYYIHLDASSGEAQDTINLPSGQYTVTELDNLNYTPEGEKVQEVTVGGEDVTVTFTNNSTPTKIPSDSGATQNNPDDEWDGNSIVAWKPDDNIKDGDVQTDETSN